MLSRYNQLNELRFVVAKIMKKIPEKKCVVEKCINENYRRGYCNRHYWQFKKYGKSIRTMHDQNEIIDCSDYYEICLYSGQSGDQKEIARTKIDKDCLFKIKNYKWGLDGDGYANGGGDGKKHIRLHRLIIGEPIEGHTIDHINHDILDNRKQNLRFVTYCQNGWNRKAKGYSWDNKRKRFHASIMANHKKIFLGWFKNEEDAIQIRKKAEVKYFGQFAYRD
jgi:hypothetical protein